MQPIMAPTFRWRAARVRGMPVALEIFALKAVMPSARFQDQYQVKPGMSDFRLRDMKEL
jgi:hypothetical protein